MSIGKKMYLKFVNNLYQRKIVSPLEYILSRQDDNSKIYFKCKVFAKEQGNFGKQNILT